MREDNKNGFDELFRSKLEDAEVKAPSGVWKSVAARLDGATAASAAWWKWAGASLAVAAALAAGLFFKGTNSPVPAAEDNSLAILTNSDNSSNSQTLVAQASENVPEPETAEPDRTLTRKDAAVQTPSPQQTSTDCAAAADGSDDAPAISVTDDTADEECLAAREEKKTVQTKGGRNTFRNGGTNYGRDVWESAYDSPESAFRPRVAIAMNGIVGGNDSQFLIRDSHSGRMASGTQNYDKTGIRETSTSTFGIPFTAGIGVRVHFTPRLSLGTGLDYSMLTRSFNGTYNEVNGGAVTKSVDGEVFHQMRYVGIPVNIYYDVLNSDNVSFYVYGGGEAEHCFSNRYTVRSDQPDIIFKDPVKGLQYSVGAGLGVEFKLNGTLGLYLDPGVQYYFHCDQPKNVRTEKSLMATFEAGLRFNL